MKGLHSISDKLSRSGRFVLIAAFGCAMLSSPFQTLLYVSFFLFVAAFLTDPKAVRLSAGRMEIILGLFLAAAVVSVFISAYQISALMGCGVFLIYALVYIYLKNVFLDEKWLNRIVGAVAIGLLAVCGFALLHYFVIRQTIQVVLPWGGSFVLNPRLTAMPGQPIESILQHPMLGANMIAVLATFLLTALLYNFRKMTVQRKVFLSAALAVALVTMALTYSRGAFLYLGVALVLLSVLTGRFKVLLVLLAAAIVFFFLPNEKLYQTLRNPMASPNINGRVLQYRAAFEIFTRSNWLTGVGVLNFRHYYLDGYGNDHDFERFPRGTIETNRVQTLGPLKERILDNMPIPYVHNVYLSLLVETGVVGFLSFFVFLGWVFVSAWKSYFRERDLPSLQVLVLIPGFLANSLFDNLLYTVPAGILIWVLIGLSQNRSLLSGDTDEIKDKGLLL